MEGDGTGATGTLRIDDVVITGRPARDLSVVLDSTSPRRPLPGEEAICHGRVVNNGTGGTGAARVAWAIDEDGDGVPSPEEVAGVIDAGPLPAGEGAGFEFSFVRTRPGAVGVFAIVEDPGGGSTRTTPHSSSSCRRPPPVRW